MWGKIIIPMYRLWLHGIYGLYGPGCPLSPKRPINLISLSLAPLDVQQHSHWPVWPLEKFLLGTYIFANAGLIQAISRSMEPSSPVNVQWHDHCCVGPLQEFPSGTKIFPDAVTPQPTTTEPINAISGSMEPSWPVGFWRFAWIHQPEA